MHRNNNPIARKSNLVVQETESELLIYDLGINKAFCLNETSALVWQLSDGTNSVSDIVGLMSKRLKTLAPEELVWLALDQLKKDNLLENGSEFEINFKGLNRREVIRKIGITSMIALPIVSSVIAPSSAYALSTDNCPPVGTCIPAGSEICGGCLMSLLCDAKEPGSNCLQPNPRFIGFGVNCPPNQMEVTLPEDCLVTLIR